MTPLANDHPFGVLALSFATALMQSRFADAYALLCNASRVALTQRQMQQRYQLMIDYADAPADACEVIIVDTSMPKKTKDDLAWVYVAITGPGFSEAVTVSVVSESETQKLRIEEWGRP